MTASVIELTVTADDRRIARYAAAAIALTVAEAAIPTPLPGVKPGLANIVVLLVLLRHGWVDAAWVSLLRVFAGSLVTGQFLAPGFFLSLTGALCSLIVLAPLVWLCRKEDGWFGPVTLSIVAAFAHIAGQLLLARLWLVPHNGIVYLIPVFASAALFFGIINGLAATALLKGAIAAPITENSQ
jgi:heptaprenyl diphosphate synthase